MPTVEDMALSALAVSQKEAAALASEGDADAWKVLRRSALGAWFPGIEWQLLDHNFPECKRHDGTRGLVVVRPAQSHSDLVFLLTVSVAWRDGSPSETWLVDPEVAAGAGGAVAVPLWTFGAERVHSPADVGRWLEKHRGYRSAAA